MRIFLSIPAITSRVLLHPLGWLCVFGLTLVSSVTAQQPSPLPPAASQADGKVITNAQEFWGLSSAEKMKMHHVRFDILVYYYDPFWQLIWGDCDGRASFLPVRGEALPVKPGQLVRLEGVVQPSRGILRSEVTVTVLKENVMPAPLPLAGQLTNSTKLDAQWTTLEGYVCRQSEVDGTHVLYEVLSEGWLVRVRVLVGATDRVPQLVNSRVRFDGVYVATHDPSQKIQGIDLWVPRVTDVKVLGELADDARFQVPRTPIDRLAGSAPGSWVRLSGSVRAFQPAQSLTIRDDSGDVTLPTPQPGSLQVGDNVDVIGRVSGTGLQVTLAEAHFRPVALRAEAAVAAGPAGAPRYNLRTVSQVTDLPVGEVARSYDVTLKGVVTWADAQAPFFYLQDSTGGICVWRDDSMRAPSIGDSLQVRGLTTLGRFAPEIRAHELYPMGTLALPEARTVTLQQALTGAEEARWVELRGYLRQVVADGGWTRLDLTTESGEFSAYAPRNESFGALIGAIVRVSGVCAAEANSRRQMSGLRLWIPGPHAVTAIELPPADPFASPRHALTGLKQFTGSAAFNHRVTIAGVVLAQVPGRYLILQEGESGLMVYTRDPGVFRTGVTVEAAGLPGFDGSRLVLREAKIRAGSFNLNTVPLRLDRPSEVLADADSRLVQVRAHLRHASWRNDHWRLTLQAGDAIFDALVGSGPDWAPPRPDTELELTGVYLLEFDEAHRPHNFLLQLRSSADLKVLSLPSWWTSGRAVTVAGGLALFAILGFSWVALLRRRVRDQTEQIRLQVEKEARLQMELERSSRLESLGVLAGGIAHDFNNLLTTILGNLGLAAMDKRVMEAAGDCVAEAEKGARRARDITQQLLTFAKGGDPVRAAVALPEIITEAANFARHGSNVRFEFDLPDDLPPGDVDAGQISRVVHNLVINAVQAMPGGGVVSFSLTAVSLADGEVDALPAGDYLRLSVADQGKGIPAEVLPRIFDPYFSTKSKAGNSGLGLATVRSVVKKHRGHIEVESRVGKGTTFRIWLPAAEHVTAPKVAATPGPSGRCPARILVMDDEDVIRRVAGRMLSLAGHETAFASDGSEAVRAYATARRVGRPFDLVIFDLTVPGGMGGKDALQELRKLDPDVRAVASSGYSSDPVMANPNAYNFQACLPKPYDIPDLMRVVEEVRR